MNSRFCFSIRIVSLLLMVIILASCSAKPAQEPENENTNDLTIYASFYPFYAIAEMITEDIPGIKLHCLVQPQDGCLRSYQLSNWDLSLLAGSTDILIAGGSGLESIENVLYSLGDNGPAIVHGLFGIDMAEYPAVNVDKDSESHWNGFNPHIYMSIEGSSAIAENIAHGLAVLDPENEDKYLQNLEKTQNRLASVYNSDNSLLAGLDNRSVIVLNEALVYAAQDFGLNIELCWARESGEELQTYDLQTCIETLSKCSSKVILIEKHAPQSLCKALEAAGFRLAKMDVLSTHRADEGYKIFLDAYNYNANEILKAFLS